MCTKNYQASLPFCVYGPPLLFKKFSSRSAPKRHLIISEAGELLEVLVIFLFCKNSIIKIKNSLRCMHFLEVPCAKANLSEEKVWIFRSKAIHSFFSHSFPQTVWDPVIKRSIWDSFISLPYLRNHLVMISWTVSAFRMCNMKFHPQVFIFGVGPGLLLKKKVSIFCPYLRLM